MNGGYTMIDCKGMNLLAQSAQTISGLYAKSLKALATGKPVIVNNCVYGTGVQMTPIPVFAIIEAGTIIFTASILQIRIASNDSVTIVSLLPTNETKTKKSN